MILLFYIVPDFVIGKVALVTGGGSGLGSMMAAALVQNGARVYIASRKEKQLKEVIHATYIISSRELTFLPLRGKTIGYGRIE